jgi:hypothetical protein
VLIGARFGVTLPAGRGATMTRPDPRLLAAAPLPGFAVERPVDFVWMVAADLLGVFAADVSALALPRLARPVLLPT